MDDVEPEVFDALLRYCYGRLAAVAPGAAVPLFRAADKYDVAGLRQQCLALLCEVRAVFACWYWYGYASSGGGGCSAAGLRQRRRQHFSGQPGQQPIAKCG